MSSDIRATIKQLRTQQHAALGKLQQKSDAEVELLEVVNAYFRKRAEIENQYAGALEKLSKHYLGRKFKKSMGPATNVAPLAPSEDAATGAVYAAFTAVLVESEKQARKRGQIGDKIVSDISDFIKDFTKSQGTGAKRVGLNVDFGTKYQQELWAAYEDLEKTKQSYDKTAKEAETAKRKYDDMAKKPGSGLGAIRNLVTGTDSEERVEKNRSKWKASSRKLNDARNEYLLSLASANTIQSSYYKEEVPQLMQNVDGSFYSAYPALLEKYSNLEDEYTGELHRSVETIRVTLKNVDRQKEVEAFKSENYTLFQDANVFYFEPCAGDEIDTVTVDDVTKMALGHRLGRLIAQEEELNVTIAHRERELAGCAQMADVYSQTPSFGNAASPLEQRQDLENALRLLNAIKARTLTQSQMLQNLAVQPIMPILPSQAGTTAASAGSIPPAGKPNAVAVYDYDSKADGEISLRDGDDLIILVPETDGWIKVRNLVSQGSGLVPASYIKAVEPDAIQMRPATSQSTLQMSAKRTSMASVAPSARQVKALYDFNATDDGELSFKAGDMIEVLDTGGDFTDEAWWEGRLARTNESGQFPIVFTQGWRELQHQPGMGAHMSAAGSMAGSMASLARAATTMSHRTSGIDIGPTSKRTSTVPEAAAASRRASAIPRPFAAAAKAPTARALYAYESTCDGELSMDVGDIITVINKNTGSDAWWEGAGPRGKGQFPVNYVEMIDEASAAGAASNRTSLIQPAAPATPAVPQIRALYDYTASADDEISFRAGDIGKLTDSSDADWYVGEFNGHSGAFPANYVQRL
ncbi:F-BAR and double SH3 domains protein 2 [Geranomyces michiganensis]|nr:F-BAR and double SH3 domains protein 2 [Geranomyces michiganensis]